MTKALSGALVLKAGLLLGLQGVAFAQTADFTLRSPDLSQGTFEPKYLLNGFGCTGENVSPALSWENAPAGTKSFSLLLHDLDAPTGSGFWHWAVYNIPASSTSLARGAGNRASALPAPAIAGTNDFLDLGVTGSNGNYGGPCPPKGDTPHRYVFTLYALGVDDVHKAAGIPPTGSAALHSFVLNRGIGDLLLGKATLTVVHGR